jgi:ribosomal protein S18 acetylase RimI-like enzyme
MPDQPSLRSARPEDVESLLDLMAALYTEDPDLPFSRADHREAVCELLATPSRGGIFVFATRDRLVGYVVLTIGFSLEFGGMTGLLDELFVVPDARGRGLGRQALAFVTEECLRRGLRAIHLEVARTNHRAQDLYRQAGFQDRNHLLLTRRTRTGAA